MGALHKAGFTYHKKQICRGDQWSPAKNVKKIKRAIRESPLQQKDREHENSLSFFHTPCSARYSVLHLFGVLSGGNIAFLREEGGTRQGFPEANEMSFGGSLRSVTEGARATLNLY